MPIPVGVLPPGPPTAAPVVGVDGVLTAVPVPSTCSVLLQVRFGAAAAAARRVTVVRSGGGSGNVRGLDAARAPSGVTAGIDHHPPVGVTVVYRAVATAADGSTWTSAPVPVLLAAPTVGTFLKSLRRPSLSVQLLTSEFPSWSDNVPGAVAYPLNAASGAGGFGRRQLPTGTWTVLTRTRQERIALQALLTADGAGPYFFQAPPANDEPDVYCWAVAAPMSRPVSKGSAPERTFALAVTQCAEPDTFESTVVMPGRTWSDLAAAFPTQAQLPWPPLRWLTG